MAKIGFGLGPINLGKPHHQGKGDRQTDGQYPTQQKRLRHFRLPPLNMRTAPFDSRQTLAAFALSRHCAV